MAFMAVLESDLRALSAEARRRYPAVKDGAEHAIIKVCVFKLLILMFACMELVIVWLQIQMFCGVGGNE